MPIRVISKYFTFGMRSKMLRLLIASNFIDYLNEVNKLYLDEDDIVEVGWVQMLGTEKYLGIISSKELNKEDIQNILKKNGIIQKYGKLQRSSESYRV